METFDKAHDELQEKLLNFCGVIYIAPSPEAPPCDIIDNGSFGLIDTGERSLLVTCCHVLDFYENERTKNPKTVMAMVMMGTGYKTQLFDLTLVDSDRDIDLAVFEWGASPSEEKSFFPVREFPIPRAEVGGAIVLQGFPRAQREGTQRSGNFGAFFFGGIITAVNDRTILVMGGEHSLTSVDTGKPLEPIELSGISGSPAYTFRNGWKLAGFVRGGKTTEHSLFLTHASFINPDGALNRGIPMQ
jgi:hypothetical protein